jgi:hypothetical protein
MLHGSYFLHLSRYADFWALHVFVSFVAVCVRICNSVIVLMALK